MAITATARMRSKGQVGEWRQGRELRRQGRETRLVTHVLRYVVSRALSPQMAV